eukprot:805-Heterococcus_DN1.PRE.1
MQTVPSGLHNQSCTSSEWHRLHSASTEHCEQLCDDTTPLEVQKLQHMCACYIYLSVDTHFARRHAKGRLQIAAFCDTSTGDQVHHGCILVCTTELTNLNLTR